MRLGPYSHMTTQMPVAVCHPPDTLVAVVIDGGGAFLSPALDEVSDNDPGKVFVAAMCLFAGQVLAGEVRGPYTDIRAAAWARALLLPARVLAAFDDLPDAAVAEVVGLPHQQVILRRRDADYVALRRPGPDSCLGHRRVRFALLAAAAEAASHAGGRGRRTSAAVSDRRGDMRS